MHETKINCDKCKQEIPYTKNCSVLTFRPVDYDPSYIIKDSDWDLCDSCAQKVRDWLKQRSEEPL